MTTQADLLRLEHAAWTSLCDGTGSEFYGALLIEDGATISADGTVHDRDAAVEDLRDAPAWGAFEIRDERLVPLGDDAAILVYAVRAFRAAGGPPYTAAASSTYLREAGEWRLALHQETPVPADDESEAEWDAEAAFGL